MAGFRSRWTIPFSMRSVQRLGDLARDRERLRDRQRTALKAFRECRAFDELQNQGGDTVGFFEAVDRADVRMVQRREQTGFARKTRAALRIGGEVGWQDLDRDVATQLRVAARERPRPCRPRPAAQR